MIRLDAAIEQNRSTRKPGHRITTTKVPTGTMPPVGGYDLSSVWLAYEDERLWLRTAERRVSVAFQSSRLYAWLSTGESTWTITDAAYRGAVRRLLDGGVRQ